MVAMHIIMLTRTHRHIALQLAPKVLVFLVLIIEHHSTERECRNI